MKRLSQIVMILAVISAGLYASEDHSEYLEGPFESGREVTEACIGCHEEAAESFLHSVHWTMLDQESKVIRDGKELFIGKRTVVNNFCIGLSSNWPRCTSCHAGYGWKDDSFDLTDTGNIDCLVCHDGTGTYKKSPAGAGIEAPGLDLEAIAKSVGPTSNRTCGACHFFGGGANNVKHGDLDVALLDGPKSLDVHMSTHGQDMQCTACHKTKDHVISGTAMSLAVKKTDLVQCENCHSANPHNSETLNDHYKSMACQTCHIPEFARANPTKMSWDWSQAGDDRAVGKDEYGMPDYDKKKGAFVWGKNVVPHYTWYNGENERMVLGDPVSLDEMNFISRPKGNKKDPKAKIYPFKVHTGLQIADKNNKYLLTPMLWKGYWSHFDWQKALEDGSKSSELPYSGEYTFVQTTMYWKINHMVAPKENVLECVDCHGPNQTRMDWAALGYEKGDPRKYGGRFSHPRNR